MSIQHVARRKAAGVADMSAKGAASVHEWPEFAGNAARSHRSLSSNPVFEPGTLAAGRPSPAGNQFNLTLRPHADFMGVHLSLPSMSKSK
jgi:hypothetical protein